LLDLPQEICAVSLGTERLTRFRLSPRERQRRHVEPLISFSATLPKDEEHLWCSVVRRV
jgi:hypothetical protein